MSRRPSFQFYPADWSSNPNLKRCTFAEKGIWLEVMCLLHDQPEYGVLRWALNEIAAAVKCRASDLRSLHRKGVVKGDDQALADAFVYIPRSGRKDGAPVVLVPVQEGPIWFSSRMVRDEYVRGLRAEWGGAQDAPKDTPNTAPKVTPKAPLGDTNGVAFGPRTSSSSSPASEGSEAKASAGIVSATEPDALVWQMVRLLLDERCQMSAAASGRFFGKILADHQIEARDMLPAVSSATVNFTGDPKSFLAKSAASIAKRRADPRLTPSQLAARSNIQ